MKCELCSKLGANIAGDMCLCEECLARIVREWHLKQQQVAKLTES
jgi:hypothetical protein